MSLITKTKSLSSPVTCLEVIEGLILAGVGPFIRIYYCPSSDNLHWINVGTCAVFKSVNIHVLRVEVILPKSRFKICAVGGKCMRILELKWILSELSVEFKSPIFTFQDWIWDSRWFPGNQIVFIMAENYVVLFEALENYSLKKFQCETKCILYCGCLTGLNWHSVIAISGTVFKEVLIWSPGLLSDDNQCCRILHRLTGHEGVIFSIVYNEELRKLCTSSDDRSVHLWKHNLNSNMNKVCEALTIDEWEASSFTLLGKVYGHESRVCKALILPFHCVSAGEDSMLCIWKKDVSNLNNYKLEKKISCHGGSAIRSIYIDSNKLLTITGGDDGGIKLWPAIPQITYSNETNFVIRHTEFGNDSKERPREIKLLDDQHVLILTLTGRLLCHDLSTKVTKLWLSDMKCKSENAIDLTLQPDGTLLISIGDSCGKVTILKTYYSSDKNSLEFAVLDQLLCSSGQVFAVKWVDPYHLLICGSNGLMDLWDVKGLNCGETVRLIAKFDLPPCRQRWVSAAKLINKFKSRLICGSRGGSVYVYDSPQQQENEPVEVIEPVQSFSRIHGTHGVSCIYIREDDDIVYTTGRDGTMNQFDISLEGLMQMIKIRIAGCPKWISGLMLIGQDLLVYGFHDERFIVWSEENQSVLTEIQCGGGHRSWDIHFSNTAFTFVYIKEGDIGVGVRDLKYSLPIPVKEGHHTRQINVVKHLFTQGSESYFATGGEDNAIRIYSMNLNMESFDNIRLERCLRSHISSVKTIGVCSLISSDSEYKDYLLVTAGGRAQIVCWRITMSIEVENECDANSRSRIKVRNLMTYMQNPDTYQSRKPWKDRGFTIDPEVRFMDIAVWKIQNDDSNSTFIIAIACSDGFIRYYSYNMITNQLILWIQHRAHGLHCILKLDFIYVLRNAIVIFAATDGEVVLCDVSQIERRIFSFEAMLSSPNDKSLDVESFIEQKIKELEGVLDKVVIKTLKLHQSGVTALAVKTQFSSNEIGHLILTSGGDDTAVSVVKMHIQSPVRDDDSSKSFQFQKIDIFKVPEAHSAQVTGIVFLAKDLIVSTSVDQRIRIWSYCNDIDLKLVSSSYSNAADSSSIAVWTDKLKGWERHHLCVVGKNIGIYEVLGKESVRKELLC